MTQYNPNPNATSNLTGWSKGGSATTLTATSEGARWVGGASGTGRYVKITVNFNFTSHLYWRLGGLSVRRNSGTARLSKVVCRDETYTSSSFTTTLTNFALTSANFVTFGSIPFDYSAAVQGDFVSIKAKCAVFIFAEDNKAFDFHIKGVGVYESNATPTEPDLDAGDANWNYSQGNNTRTVSVSYVPGNEAVDTCTWNWGDGTANTVVAASVGTASHTYAASGIYNVAMTATGHYGNKNIFPGPSAIIADTFTSATKPITVPVGTFTAGFSYETDFLNVNVDASSSIAPSLSPIDTYAWNWGDGQTTAANASKYASHSYAAPGTYNVTLTVKDNATNRTDTEVKAVVVTAPPNPDNYFVAVRDLLKVSFVPSIQDGTSYSWNFGDGGTSTDKEPVHTYDSPGTYTVSVLVNGTLTATQAVTVNEAYTPLGNLMDALRLEVAVPYPSGTPYNRIKNPSGDLGAWGWITPVTNAYLTGSTTNHETADKGITGAKLIYRSSGAGTQWLTSAALRVPAGQYVSVQLQSPYVDGYYRARVDALDAAGAVLGSSATTGYQQASQTAVVRTTPYLLPAGTTQARVVLYFLANTSDAVPAVNKIFQFRRVMLATAATSAELTTLPYAENADWQDLIGPTSEIAISREALNVGTLTAMILDSTFDPASNGTIRPGQTVRLRAKTPDDAGNVRWQSIFTGTVNEAAVDYVAVKGSTPGPKATKIKLTASDAVTTLAQFKEPRGVAKIKELPHLLEGVNVPYEVNGSTAQIPSASIVNANDNASVLDQVAITRDTDGGYAFVDRDGVLKVLEPEYMPTVPSGVIDETHYSDISAGFNTSDAINSVVITWLRYVAASGSEPAKVEEVPYGPYTDDESIEEWGLRTATFTMLGVENPTTIASRAAAILDANSQPSRMITNVQIPIRNLEDLTEGKALLDLYSLVRLGYARTETDELIRVTSIQHKITPKRWLLNLGFSADGAVASPQLVASLPVTAPTSGSFTATAANVTWATDWNQFDNGANAVVYARSGNVHVLYGVIKRFSASATTMPATTYVATITSSDYVHPPATLVGYADTNSGIAIRVFLDTANQIGIQKSPITASWSWPANDAVAFSLSWIA